MVIQESVLGLAALVTVFFSPVSQPLLSPVSEIREMILAEQSLDLKTRHRETQINEAFAFNILHALEFFPSPLILRPNEVFVFHEMVLPEFEGDSLVSSQTRYLAKEGYQTVLGLPGNGVCHLASLMNWVASEAGLEVKAEVNHRFAPIPGVPEEHGTSIRYTPDGRLNSQKQNLYLKNNFDYPVEFIFETKGEALIFKINRFFFK